MPKQNGDTKLGRLGPIWPPRPAMQKYKKGDCKCK